MRWALIQYDWCPYKKRKIGSRHREKKATWAEGRDWGDESTSQGTSKVASKPPGVRSELGSPSASEGDTPWSWLMASRPEGVSFCCSRHLVRGALFSNPRRLATTLPQPTNVAAAAPGMGMGATSWGATGWVSHHRAPCVPSEIGILTCSVPWHILCA